MPYLSYGSHNIAIYRTISVERFFKLIKERKLVFLNPSLWDDPYENFLFKFKFKTTDGGLMDYTSLVNEVYGLCWTKNFDTDFGWRVYAKEKNGVKFKINVLRLHDYLNNQVQNDGQDLLLFGNVTYKTITQIKHEYEDPKRSVSDHIINDISARKFMFLKRNEFQHENEYRMIYIDRGGRARENKFIDFEFDPIELIEQVTFDPRMDDSSVKRCIDDLNDLQFPIEDRLVKSTIYDPPEINPIVNTKHPSKLS